MFNNIFNIEKKITNPNKILFISPPFGNYFTFLPNTIPIRGSFTLKERKGKWMQILKTLRYIPLLNGWVNKIGLRNPGIDYAIRTYKKGEIISPCNGKILMPLYQEQGNEGFYIIQNEK